MDAVSPQYPGGRIVAVEGLLGRLLKKPTQNQPAGEDKEQWMRVTALQAEGKPIGFSTYRPADLSGQRPWWYELAYNVGDVDAAPVGIPMGPRHFSVYARPQED